MKWLRPIVFFLAEPAVIGAYAFMLYGSLFLAAVGQALLLGAGKEAHFALMPILMLPGYVVFFLTYFNVSPVPPRVYLALLLLAMAWYGTVTIVCEVLLLTGEIPAAAGPQWQRNVPRAVMHVGWISFIPISSLYRSVQKYIMESRVSDNTDPPC